MLLNNQPRQVHLYPRVADVRRPHGIVIALSSRAPRVRVSCFVNFAARQGRRCDPTSFREKANRSTLRGIRPLNLCVKSRHQYRRESFKKKTQENGLVFTNLARAHAVVVFVKLVDRPLSLGNCLLATGLGSLVACFDFLGLTFTPLPVFLFYFGASQFISRVCLAKKKKTLT